MFKGKNSKSWPQLPPELVRQIATYVLWDIAYTGYMPQAWENPQHWHQRLVFATLRDANELEQRVMKIFPEWAAAMQSHLFWPKAIHIMDPTDAMAPYAVVHPKPTSLNNSAPPPAPIRLTAYQHFKNILNCSCVVCRVNSPGARNGLMKRKLVWYTPWLRSVGVCAEHSERIPSFCGLCLRDAPVFQHEGGAHMSSAGVAVNEDKDTFANVYATCRSCRSEFLWKRVRGNRRDEEAVGGKEMLSDDWETRNVVDTFIDNGEGSVREVLALARERLWLKNNTRIRDMLDQALAASRLNDEYEGNVPDEEDEEEDEEVILMQMEEEGVRDIALGDWARSRIMDGHWISPADIWYQHFVPTKSKVIPAIHPCPWSRDVSSLDSPVSLTDEEPREEEHPRMSTVMGEVPPTFALCEQSLMIYRRQLREILAPAMKNLVRKIVIECATPCYGGAEDPVQKVNKMTLEDVITQLREEDGLWFDGIDWAERRLNSFLEAQQRERNSSRCQDDIDDTSTLSSGGSSRSPTDTSPVLSTSTLQTTPSPPPLRDEDDTKKDDIPAPTPALRMPRNTAPPVIAVGPVLDPPKILRSIPFIPETAAYFPSYTREDITLIWRDVCAPLYHCRCRICLRSVALENAANGNKFQEQPVDPLAPAAEVQPQAPVPRRVDNVVRLEEVNGVDMDGEGDIDEELGMEYMNDEEICAEIDAEIEAGFSSDADEPDVESTGQWYYRRMSEAFNNLLPQKTRKRSSDELDTTLSGLDETEGYRTCTPPKRPKMEQTRAASQLTVIADHPTVKHNLATPQLPITPPISSPGRHRKRSSEELEDFDAEKSFAKKAKVSQSATPISATLLEGEVMSTSPPPSSRPSSGSA